jgi:hypothetical protein
MPHLLGGWSEVVIGAVHTAPACPSTNVRSVFTKEKTGPINSPCINPAHMFTLGLPLSNSQLTCGFLRPQIVQLYLFTAPLTWDVVSSEKHTWQRKSSDVLILSSMSTANLVRATWSLGFSAWIIWILYTLRRSFLCSTSCTVESGMCM